MPADQDVELDRLNDDLINLQASAKLPIVLLGRDLTIRRFSPQAEQALHLTAADLGCPIGSIRHDFVVDAGVSAPLDLERISAGVIAAQAEQEVEVHDQRGNWHLLRVCPYLTADRMPDGAVLVLVDITQRKRAEEVPARLAAIVTSSDDAIISKNLQGIIQTWNAGATRLFGYTGEEAIGKPATLLMPRDRVDEEAGILERLRRGETIDHYETVRRRKDGSLVSISLTVSPVRDAAGRVIGAAKIARDITHRKRAEALLDTQRDALRLADQRKNEFLAMLGHELRNPLSALTHGLDLQGKSTDDPARSEELRAMMVRQTERMTTLLDQLLDVSRVISNRVELAKDRVDLEHVVRAAIETVRPLVESQRHELVLSLPREEHAVVVGDAVRLTQVVENLLTNALKYTEPGGRVDVALEWDQDKVRVIVRDTGVGIDADFLPHVFEVFTQAPRTLDRANGGLGLGLPLSRRLIEMHGGEVEASSPGPGQGSMFVVTLPLVRDRRSAPRVAARAAPAPAASTAARHCRILVVDNEVDTAASLAEVLQRLGHEVAAVNDGPAALAAIGTFDPEVVLMDLGMPGMDGYEVARRLREAHGQKLFLIAVTGYSRDSARLEQAGFDDHLIKPTKVQRLSAMLAARDRVA